MHPIIGSVNWIDFFLKMDSNYYKDYFELERSHWWFLARNEIILSQVEEIYRSKGQRLKIINVGVATGASSEMLAQFGEVTSIEYEQDCVDFTKSKIDIDIQLGTILDLQFPDETFDLVCSFDVIEHVENDQLAASELMRICKKGGFVFITVPAFMSIWSQHDVINHHVKRYVISEIHALFSNVLKTHYVSYFNFPLSIPIFIVRFFDRFIPGSIKRNETNSDFDVVTNDWLNKLFYKIFITEKAFIKRKFHFPFGVSIMGIWQK